MRTLAALTQRMLFKPLRAPTVIVTVPGAMHNDVFAIAGADIAGRIAMGEAGFDG
jgi:hypothetical protein